VREAVDGLAGEVRGGGEHRLVFWLLRPFVGQGDDVDARDDLGMLPGSRHLVAVQPDVMLHRRQAGEVVLGGFQG